MEAQMFEQLRNLEYVVLDTETTGLGSTVEIVEICILDGRTSEVLLDTLVKPSITISAEASNIHGIYDEDVKDSPSWELVYPLVRAFVKDMLLVIYNVGYDTRIMDYACNQINLRNEDLYGSKGYYCAMREYTEFRGVEDFFKKSKSFIGLGKALKNEGLILPPSIVAHRAKADVLMVQSLIKWQFLKQDEQLEPLANNG